MVDILLYCCLLGEMQCWKVGKKHHLCLFPLLHQSCLAYLWLCTSPFGTLSCDYGWCTCNCLSKLSHRDSPVTTDWQLRERNHYWGGNSKSWNRNQSDCRDFLQSFLLNLLYFQPVAVPPANLCAPALLYHRNDYKDWPTHTIMSPIRPCGCPLTPG